MTLVNFYAHTSLLVKLGSICTRLRQTNLEKRRTINGEYYASLLAELGKEITNKRPHLAKKKVLFHQDNACVHNCAVAMATLHDAQIEVRIIAAPTLFAGKSFSMILRLEIILSVVFHERKNIIIYKKNLKLSKNNTFNDVFCN